MAEKCPYCKTKVKSSEQQVNCPSCGTLYHYGCWKYFTEKCAICGLENEDYKEAKRQAEERKLNKSQPQQETKTAKEYVNTVVNYNQININNTLNNQETGMFANIGEKIKAWAKAITVIGIISGIITFFAMFLSDEDLFFAALLAGVGAAVTAYTTSLLLYAFGELVANSKESKNIQQQILDELRSKDQNKE